MRIHSGIVRGLFHQQNHLVASLDRARSTPANSTVPRPRKAFPIPPIATAHGQTAFFFHEPALHSRRRSRQVCHELAIAKLVTNDPNSFQRSPQLLHWAQRRLSLERFRTRQRARAQELARKRERQLETCEQRQTAVLRGIGMLVRKLDGLHFADTRTIANLSNELRRLAEQCASAAN